MSRKSDLPEAFQPFQQFLDDLRARGRSVNTLRAYRMDWKQFTQWFVSVNDEPITLETLTALDVQDFVRWSQQEGLKASTINRRLGLIKHFVTWAEESNLIETDLRRRVKRVNGARKQTLAPQSLDSVTVRQLLRELERAGMVRDRAIVYTLLYTGIRVGELVSLRRIDVILRPRSGSLTIRAEIAKGSKERIVPIPGEARKMMQVYFDNRQMSDADIIFTGREGPLSAPGVAAMLRKYAKRINVESITPHILRHTFAYNYLENNQNDLVALADILGHSDLNTTRMYTRRRFTDLKHGVEQVKFY